MAHSYEQNKPLIMDIIKEINPDSILDVGIGAGDYGSLIRKAFPNIILKGIDIWDEYDNEQWNNYNEITLADMRDAKFDKVDLTIFIDSLEHIYKEEAFKVLNKVHNDILISIPINYKQPEELDKYDKHLSEWSIEDFKGMDYQDFSNDLSLILLIKK